jgi:pimeloyl-ACP methyl ester carboxylesterase
VPDIELSAGTISYEDTGGDGPTLVFIHGVLMNASVWQQVVDGLPADFRCIRPTWPLGGHRQAMRPDADLSLRGIALLVGEFLDRLDLQDVTLVQNDWGGAQVLIANGSSDRIAALVLTSCEAFDNYPPGLPGRALALVSRTRVGLALFVWTHRFHVVRRAPGGMGWMSKRPVPDAMMTDWLAPLTADTEIRADLSRYAREAPDRATLLRWAQDNEKFTGPVLVAWAADDKVMPRAHGEQLAELYPNGRLQIIDDSYTLVPIDQPAELAKAITEFVGARV